MQTRDKEFKTDPSLMNDKQSKISWSQENYVRLSIF